jgi:hypothetical protein
MMNNCPCSSPERCKSLEYCVDAHSFGYPIDEEDERMAEGAAIIVSLVAMVAVGVLGFVWLGLRGLGVL